MSNTKPILISIEGPEYSGKTSLVNQLYQILPNAKLARLPGGTALGEQLRPIIKTQKISALAQLGLNFAIMCELYETLSKLEGYDYILLDRNVESIFVYQGLIGKLFNNSDSEYFCMSEKQTDTDRILPFPVLHPVSVLSDKRWSLRSSVCAARFCLSDDDILLL